jgi:hypothetical protein
MALIASLSALLAAAIFCLACAGLGEILLKAAGLRAQSTAEQFLRCVAVGTIAYETVLGALLFVLHPRFAVPAVLIALAVSGSLGFRRAMRTVAEMVRRIFAGSRAERAVSAVTAGVLLLAGLAATAPLTGSDALHYHFTSQLALLRNGFAPDFSLVHTFFAGQGHLLILTGLALHSEKCSLALIFLGGVLAAASAACLARCWVSREWAWLCALIFLLTPVVFWQISTAGAPDIWMAFFATLAVLTISSLSSDPRWASVLLCGAFAGAIAGAKYTGCFFAVSLLAAFSFETRSLRRLAGFFGMALAAGMWPYLRNTLWSHDPLFPFLLRWLAPERVNAFTLASIRADTGAASHASWTQALLFPVFAGIHSAHTGFWEFFGPLPLAFLPLIFLAVRRTPLWRAAGIFLVLSGLLVAFSSAMLRFLLPTLPVALAAAIAGADVLSQRPWPLARFLSRASIGALLLLCAGGAVYYAAPSLQASLGLISRETYLQQRAPDYGRTSFINQHIASLGGAGKTLVFLQHLYYLQVPFVNGNPDSSWDMDPQRYASTNAWLDLFRSRGIRWVVRAPEYPSEIAAPLQNLEKRGVLIPAASGSAIDFTGMRIAGIRQSSPIVILQVQTEPTPPERGLTHSGSSPP